MFLSSGEGREIGPVIEVSPSPHLRMETDPVSETLFFLVYVEFLTIDKVQKPSNSEISCLAVYHIAGMYQSSLH
jgi:hypothetical protein